MHTLQLAALKTVPRVAKQQIKHAMDVEAKLAKSSRRTKIKGVGSAKPFALVTRSGSVGSRGSLASRSSECLERRDMACPTRVRAFKFSKSEVGEKQNSKNA